MRMIFEDSRQQRGKHDNINAWLILHDIEIRRTKLFVGDYTLPTDQSVCVDTKLGLQEVYGNIIQDHERFIRECTAANDAGIRLIVLVEESGIRSVQDVAFWPNPREKIWKRLPESRRKGRKPPVKSESLCKAMQTISEKYGVEWRFCDRNDTANVLCEILGIEVNNNG